MLVATAALEVATVLVALVVVTLAVLVFPEAFFEDVETDLAVLAVTVTVDWAGQERAGTAKAEDVQRVSKLKVAKSVFESIMSLILFVL